MTTPTQKIRTRMLSGASARGYRFVRRGRGASTLTYGVIVGLVAFSAIVTVTDVGDSIRALFFDAEEALDGAGLAGGGGGGGDSGDTTPPVWTTPAGTFATIAVGEALSGRLLATDDSGEPPSYALLSGPSWLQIASDGTLSGTPTIDDTYGFAAEAVDGAGNAEPRVFIVVVQPATPSVPDLAAADDSGASNTDDITNVATGVTFTGTGVEGSTITLRVNGTAAGTAVVSGGVWSIDSTEALMEGSNSVTAIADINGEPTPESLALTVTLDTDPPVFSGSTDFGTVEPSATLSGLAATASGALSYSPLSGFPAGITVNGATGAVTGTAPSSGGTLNLVIQAADAAGNTAQQTYTLTVGESCSGGPVTVTVTGADDSEQVPVPAGCTQATVTMIGGGGGGGGAGENANGGNGGAGGRVVVNLTGLTSLQTLLADVGQGGDGGDRSGEDNNSSTTNDVGGPGGAGDAPRGGDGGKGRNQNATPNQESSLNNAGAGGGGGEGGGSSLLYLGTTASDSFLLARAGGGGGGGGGDDNNNCRAGTGGGPGTADSARGGDAGPQGETGYREDNVSSTSGTGGVNAETFVGGGEGGTDIGNTFGATASGGGGANSVDFWANNGIPTSNGGARGQPGQQQDTASPSSLRSQPGQGGIDGGGGGGGGGANHNCGAGGGGGANFPDDDNNPQRVVFGVTVSVNASATVSGFSRVVTGSSQNGASPSTPGFPGGGGGEGNPVGNGGDGADGRIEIIFSP